MICRSIDGPCCATPRLEPRHDAPLLSNRTPNEANSWIRASVGLLTAIST
jgi:hypothetical protein